MTCFYSFEHLPPLLSFTLCTPGDVELLGVSVSGRLQRITAPVSREDDAAPQGSSAPVGRGVRELLSAIGDVCER